MIENDGNGLKCSKVMEFLMKKFIILSSLLFAGGLFAEEVVIEESKLIAYTYDLGVRVELKKNELDEESAESKEIENLLQRIEEDRKVLFAALKECREAGTCKVYSTEVEYDIIDCKHQRVEHHYEGIKKLLWYPSITLDFHRVPRAESRIREKV